MNISIWNSTIWTPSSFDIHLRILITSYEKQIQRNPLKEKSPQNIISEKIYDRAYFHIDPPFKGAHHLSF